MDVILAVLEAGDATRRRVAKIYDRLAEGNASQPATQRRDASMVIEHEEAVLSWSADVYRCQVRRLIRNDGDEPIEQHRVRVVVDRYPHDPDLSNRHHRNHPLTWEELDLHAWCDGIPMNWRMRVDRDADKEALLVLANEKRRFPLYPGRSAEILYSYEVSTEKWGLWFARSIKFPTRALEIVLDLPNNPRPSVWGMQTSELTGSKPFATPIVAEAVGERARFSWEVDDPAFGTQYRMEWLCED